MPERGAQQLLDVFSLVDLSHEDCVSSRRYTRLKQIEHLLSTGQIDDTFAWRPVGHTGVVS